MALRNNFRKLPSFSKDVWVLFSAVTGRAPAGVYGFGREEAARIWQPLPVKFPLCRHQIGTEAWRI